MAEWSFLDKEVGTPHAGHGSHLCVAHVMNWIHTNFDEYKKIVKNGKHVCRQCGRVAHDAKYLCDPDDL